MAHADQAVVRDWLKALGALAAGSLSSAEVNAKLTAYTPLLAQDFGLTAFCPGSLAEVARKCRFFPSYAELCEHLGAWWRDHRPAQPEITGHTADAWSRRVEAEKAEAEADWNNPAIVQAAARKLIGHPMRGVLGPMLEALVNRHSPENVQYLPPDWGVDSQPAEQAPPRPKPLYLTPEQAQAARDEAQKRREYA